MSTQSASLATPQPHLEPAFTEVGDQYGHGMTVRQQRVHENIQDWLDEQEAAELEMTRNMVAGWAMRAKRRHHVHD